MCADRYTRLKAIKDFGYDIDWENLRDKHVGIIGIGGLGCITSEMAVRCGIGKITLFDFDTVEILNLNRAMYKIEDVGRSKVEVASEFLNLINPDVKVRYFNSDIMNPKFEKIFEHEISSMDIILNGLDNLPAREYLNAKCVHFNIPYIDAGASRSGLSGYVHPIIPYKTACANCIKSISINVSEERGESCVASLPSTMAILGSIQVQEMLKLLFEFGQLIDYVMYDMISGKFFHYVTKRDKNCLICGNKEKKIKNGVQPKVTDKEIGNIIKKFKDK
jgi:ubiquitin-like modifier-activating enzyme 5